MKSSSLIVWLLVAACIAIDLAMIAELQIRRNEWPEAGGVVGLGLAFSQITLIAMWTVWGRINILVRGVSTLLGVWAVSYLASYSADGGPESAGGWFGGLLLYCGVSLIPFTIASFARYELSNQDAGNPPTASRQLPSNQFTIWGLLSLMTAVGITLAVARFAEFPVRRFLELSVFFMLLAATVCTVLLLSLFPSRMRNAIIATIVLCPIVGILLWLTDVAPAEGPLELILMSCTLGAATLAIAIVIRIAGYRLVRGGKPSEARELGASDACGSEAAHQRDEP